MKTATSKKTLQAKAKAKGEKTFLWACKTHGEHQHYTGSGACVECQRQQNAKRTATHEAREQYNAYMREWYAANANRLNEQTRERKTTDQAFLGAERESAAGYNWRKDTGGQMHGWYELEREAIRRKYAEVLEGFDIDHSIPKQATDAQREHVAVGLHSFANTRALFRKVNRWKAAQFDPENNRDQRPANRYPAGAFDPYPTEHEWSVIAEQSSDLKVPVVFGGIEFVADVIEGTDMETLLETLVADLDRKAQEHEAHVAMLEDKTNWPALVMPEVPPVSIPAMIERRRTETSNLRGEAANNSTMEAAA